MKMNRAYVAALCVVGFLAVAVSSQTQTDYPTVKYRAASNHVGDIVWVEGKILRTEKVALGTYLLFSSNKKHLRILVPASDMKNFESGVKHYAGKNVKAVGKVTEYGELLILGVNEPKRLKVVQ